MIACSGTLEKETIFRNINIQTQHLLSDLTKLKNVIETSNIKTDELVGLYIKIKEAGDDVARYTAIHSPLF